MALLLLLPSYLWGCVGVELWYSMGSAVDLQEAFLPPHVGQQHLCTWTLTFVEVHGSGAEALLLLLASPCAFMLILCASTFFFLSVLFFCYGAKSI